MKSLAVDSVWQVAEESCLTDSSQGEALIFTRKGFTVLGRSQPRLMVKETGEAGKGVLLQPEI
jgi:hypothetical protein